MSDQNGANGNAAVAKEPKEVMDPAAKKARLEDGVEEKDFDKETQKALEEIDANQNEIDALNERKFYRFCQP